MGNIGQSLTRFEGKLDQFTQRIRTITHDEASFSWVCPARWHGRGSILELYTKVAKEKKMAISEQESSQPYM